MPRSSDLLSELLTQLRAIVPSRDQGISYFPCRVGLHDGSVHERVYLIDAEDYARTWGLVPDRAVLSARDVVRIEEAPDRLPAEFATTLYRAGESGMGYCVFELRFRDGSEHAYVTGNAIDFLAYPEGQSPDTVLAVRPGAGRAAQAHLGDLPYEWCPIVGLAQPATSAAPPSWWKFWNRVTAT
jgi:hypothetical protein